LTSLECISEIHTTNYICISGATNGGLQISMMVGGWGCTALRG